MLKNKKDRIVGFVKMGILSMMLATSITVLMPSTEAFAAGGSEGSGGNLGGVKCTKPDGTVIGTICTRYGAEWRYYETDSDDVYIQGVSGTMAASGHIVGCGTNGGGYYRYAMVAYAARKDGSYVAGDQVGLTAIGGGPFRSVHFGGRMMEAPAGSLGNKNTGSGPAVKRVSWDEAKDKYEEYQRQFPSDIKLGYNEKSSLSWFCAEPPKVAVVTGSSCSAWDPKALGYAYVLTVVKNDRLTGAYSGWRQAPRPGYNNGMSNIELNTTYAKPDDEIHWIMCYWPGQEKNKHAKAVYINGIELGRHNQHTNCGDENTFVELKDTTTPPWPTSFHYFARTTAGGYIDGPGEFTDIEEEGVDMIKDVEYTDKFEVGPGDVGAEYYDAIWTDGDASKQATTVDDWCTPTWNCKKYYKKTDADGNDIIGDDGKPEMREEITQYTHNKIKGTFVIGSVASSAYVKVPYNFVAEIKAGIKDPEKPLYSGTNFAMSFVKAYINAKDNAVVEDTYTTIARDARIKVFAYVADTDKRMEETIFDDLVEMKDADGNVIQDKYDLGCRAEGGVKQCIELESTQKSILNPGENPIWGEIAYNAFDANAGDRLCIQAAMTPFSSGDDTNIYVDGFNWSWIFSEPSCKIIAKKPFFQVWGGDMYSVSSVDSFVASKRNVLKNYIGDVSGSFDLHGSATTDFASWVEEGLVLKTGTTDTVASGAAMSFTNASKQEAGKGGYDACSSKEFSPLTLANNGCPVGKSEINSAFENESDRDNLINYWLGINGVLRDGDGNPISAYAGGTVGLSGGGGTVIKNATGANIRYINASDGTNITGGIVPVSTTYLIKSSGTINIKGNIEYTSNSLSRPSEIPKVVIYAGNVNISCGVTEVDAIIVTREKGTLNTCSDPEPDTNGLGDFSKFQVADDATLQTASPNRDNQLKIFGIVIADNLVLGRTYGGSAWDSSIHPEETTDNVAAEVFDYDASIPIWSEFMAGAAQTDTLQTVYQHELAPRY